jgi:hypothetical protein
MDHNEKILEYINNNGEYLINTSFKNGLNKYNQIINKLNSLKITYPQILSHLLGNKEKEIYNSINNLVGGSANNNKLMVTKFEELIEIIKDNNPEDIKELLLKIIKEYENIKTSNNLNGNDYISIYPSNHEILMNIYFFGNNINEPILDDVKIFKNIETIKNIIDEYILTNDISLIKDDIIELENFDMKYESIDIKSFNSNMLEKIRSYDENKLKDIMKDIIYVNEYVKLVNDKKHYVKLDFVKRGLNFRLLPSKLFDGTYEYKINNDIFDGINYETLRKTTLLRMMKNKKIYDKYHTLYFHILNSKLNKITIFAKKNIIQKIKNERLINMMDDDDIILIDDLPDNFKAYLLMIDYCNLTS